MAKGSETAARRYAEAAFQLATRDDALDDYAEGLDLAARELGDERIVAVLRIRRGRCASASTSSSGSWRSGSPSRW